MKTEDAIMAEWNRAHDKKHELADEIARYRKLLEKHADDSPESPSIITWNWQVKHLTTQHDMADGMCKALEWVMRNGNDKMITESIKP